MRPKSVRTTFPYRVVCWLSRVRPEGFISIFEKTKVHRLTKRGFGCDCLRQESSAGPASQTGGWGYSAAPGGKATTTAQTVRRPGQERSGCHQGRRFGARLRE